jgi:hypothetical protein
MFWKSDYKFDLTPTQFTPDIATLELSQFHLLFVCDDLMRAGKNYKLIADSSTTVARGFTLRGYNFYRKVTDGTPVVMAAKQVKNRYDFSCLKIKGEIHCVETPAIVKLDTHYQNGVQFRRKRVQILYPTRQHGQVVNKSTDGKPLPYTLQGRKHFLLPERVDPIWTWMYIGTSKYWDKLLDGGFAFEPVRIVEPEKERDWLIKYYSWRNQP